MKNDQKKDRVYLSHLKFISKLNLFKAYNFGNKVFKEKVSCIFFNISIIGLV